MNLELKELVNKLILRIEDLQVKINFIVKENKELHCMLTSMYEKNLKLVREREINKESKKIRGEIKTSNNE